MPEYTPYQIKTSVTQLIHILKIAQGIAKTAFFHTAPERLIDERFRKVIEKCKAIELMIINKTQYSHAIVEILFQLKDHPEILIKTEEFVFLEQEIRKHEEDEHAITSKVINELKLLANCKKIILNIQVLAERTINQLIKEKVIPG